MRINKSIIIKTIILIFSVSLILTGCNSGSKKNETANLDEKARYELDENTPAWKLDKKEEKTELTWYVNAEWWNTDFGNDTVTKKLSEDLNINIKFLNGDDTKLNTYFAGSDLPDIITIFGMESKTAKDAAKWALPLNDLADKYDPYFYKVAQDQTLNWFQLKDGKTYGYPSYSNTKEHYDSGAIPGNDAFIIREDIYKAIGSPDMTTPEGFLDALGKIKAQFPKVLPFGFKGFTAEGDAGSLHVTLQDYLGVPMVTEDGKWYNRNQDEDYQAWIKVINEAYRKGYISDDTFSDDGTLFEEKISQGKYATALTGGIAQLYTHLQKNFSSNPSQKYIAIDGPKSTVGREPTLNQSGISGWSVTYISNKVKDPQKAIQLFTYLLSEEGQYLTTYGVEGETFKFNEEGKAELLPEVAKIKEENIDEYKSKYRLGEFWFFGHDTFAVEHGVVQPRESVDQIMAWGTPYLTPHFAIENIDPDQGTAESRTLTNINSQWATTLAQLIRAKDDNAFEKTLNSYKKFLDENNFDSIIKIRDQKVQDNMEKLGLK
ncbi:hypothetical protein [Bacillus kwashiorkori]|uniref:hypothetical protein n=1 Tax=Bacillus kwashiorkori TaxID=1522318 RepID=UPI000783DE45|nr:hypothetical protein [Bacillus kwashiorkori]